MERHVIINTTVNLKDILGHNNRPEKHGEKNLHAVFATLAKETSPCRKTKMYVAVAENKF